MQERRRILHIRIVEAIERFYPARLSEHVEVLAHHASRGELWDKAVEYFHQAGEKSAARSANRQAIASFEQALDALKHLPESRRTLEQAINIRVDLGPALTATSNFSAPKVEENYTRARELCERFGETPQLFPVLWGLARMHDDRGELRVGRGLGEQLLGLAQRAQDPALLLEAHHELWANLSARGELVSAHSHMEQGIALYDPQKHRDHAFRYGGHDPGVCCRYQASEVLWLLGYPDQALRRSQNSLTLARELSHATTMSVALSWTAWFDQVRGEKQSLQARIHEGVALATEKGFLMGRVQATFLQGWLLVEEGHAKTGIAQMFEIFVTEPAMGVLGSLRFHIRQAALLGDAYRKSGQTVDGLNVVNDAIARTQLSECRCYEAELHRIKGELLITQPVPSEEQAEGCFREAIKVARGQSAKSLELRAAMSLCRLRQRQGKTAEAQQLLGDIYGWFTEGFETADLKAAKALLNELT